MVGPSQTSFRVYVECVDVTSSTVICRWHLGSVVNSTLVCVTLLQDVYGQHFQGQSMLCTCFHVGKPGEYCHCLLHRHYLWTEGVCWMPSAVGDAASMSNGSYASRSCFKEVWGTPDEYFFNPSVQDQRGSLTTSNWIPEIWLVYIPTFLQRTH